MPVPIEPSGVTGLISETIAWVLGTMWTALLVLVGIVWRKHNEEIASKKTDIGKGTPLTTFKSSEEELKQDIRDLRDSMENNDEKKRLAIIDLHRKVEATATELRGDIKDIDRKADERHRDLMNALMSRK